MKSSITTTGLASAVFIAVLFGSAVALSFNGNDKTVIDTLAWTNDLSQIYSMIERNRISNLTIQIRGVTVFAPQNEAFLNKPKQDNDDEYLPCYHMTNIPLKLEQLAQKDYVGSELDGNPPIWITKKSSEEIYVNQAKIVYHLANYEHANSNGQPQVLHVIDQVLEPLRMKKYSNNFKVYNPNAWEFMENAENLDLDIYHTNTFLQRVQFLDKRSIFSNQGGHTFFIPVDEVANYPQVRPEKIDVKVVDAHIVPDHVLFLGPTNEGERFETLAFTDMLKVVATISRSEEGDKTKYFVSSDTILGDSVHPSGAVVAEIVKANIPVRNGVVHLISRPLMIVDNNVKQFVESYKFGDDGILHRFYEEIMNSGGDFMEQLTAMPNVTLFAPSNAAFNDPTIQPYLTNRTYIRSLLNLHIVNRRLSLDDIDSESVDKRFQVPTEVPRKDLFFNVYNNGKNRTLTVEGGGVNATVVQANLAATNGIIHIIDHVLGIPSSTVDRKLATDPTLNDTNYLGQISSLNHQLCDMQKRFTYFVPRDFAWRSLSVDNPSVYKRLFMPENAYIARQILERHLIVADKAYTMEDLRREANNNYNLSVKLPTVRDVSMYVKIKDTAEGYSIEWRNEWIHVHRADVRCTNGIIHVIDKVLIDDNDIDANSAIATKSVTALLLVIAQCIVFYYFN